MASGRLLAGLLEQLGAGVFGGRLVADLAGGLELAVADEAAGMDDALGDALAVEMGDLFQELVVLQRGRTAAADGALRLVVGDRMPLPVRQNTVGRSGRCLGGLAHRLSPLSDRPWPDCSEPNLRRAIMNARAPAEVALGEIPDAEP